MILVFDTETTGLPVNYNAPYTDTINWPRLVQVAASLWTPGGKLANSICILVRPTGHVIPENMIHGISHEHALLNGLHVITALEMFSHMVQKASLVVCHNYGFDFPVIAAELERNGFSEGVNRLKKTPHYCTKEQSTDLCKIPKPTKYSFANTQYKWPSLAELHTFLFGTVFDGAHDASADMMATARCFFELKRRETRPTHTNRDADLEDRLLDDMNDRINFDRF